MSDKNDCYNLRRISEDSFSLTRLIEAARNNTLDSELKSFDEVDIPLDNNKTVTAICAVVGTNWARFILKDPYCTATMNNSAPCSWPGERPSGESSRVKTYRDSEARMRIVRDLWYRVSPEWRDIITPRTTSEDGTASFADRADGIIDFDLVPGFDILGDEYFASHPAEPEAASPETVVVIERGMVSCVYSEVKAGLNVHIVDLDTDDEDQHNEAVKLLEETLRKVEEGKLHPANNIIDF